MSLDQLISLGTVDIEWSDGSEMYELTAVPLESVLRGADLKPGSLGSQFGVLATGGSGDQLTLSIGELAEQPWIPAAYVAVKKNGGPIDEGTGPLRLIVPTETEPRSSVRNLERLTVLDWRAVTSGPRAH